MIVNNILDKSVKEALTNDKLIVAKTDTIYGILARADSVESMKKLYEAKQRSPKDPSIILVADANSIPGLTSEQRKIYQELSNHQPTTVAINVSDNFLPHLPRNNDTLAFRAVPNSPLSSLIKSTGYLLAPSANPKDLPPARNITEAIEYFGETVAVYVDSGEVSGAKPSQIVAFGDENQVVYIRK